jgi:hypothetical protein
MMFCQDIEAHVDSLTAPFQKKPHILSANSGFVQIHGAENTFLFSFVHTVGGTGGFPVFSFFFSFPYIEQYSIGFADYFPLCAKNLY